ncbi:MBL fold metallo-hydrolase [Mycolicibacterium goodii]|uniref:MBL fold metallo-hydrolase n=1 Tax=Mycolicibacterium goodii TaxID=134601 RepID=A0ABS6HV30_MYCGD|nr:MBL fold metallo-hydrolase [Mycolicibacterium goodii]OKH68802.1 beta-lactamase [Mycobacterium sp. SWH-M5]MBU8813260.1 MBL fold metallo-hydrolase [Mycolicibacterium goodii]MBU8826166.1 MBL fold metallo-hydrolase [Mycolicibacterium goodii]MBU8839523.1 MBL fold metallo-hydrolase [Mycolicibacterium goodii]ULN45047.1 MBL fold metallo-hydrolase [Mycolicibacterium goodii]
MTTTMTQIRSDLWQTRTDTPFPGLTTHAYLWKTNGRNVLFYCPATDADFPTIDRLGGVDDQYLSHQDEAGPMLARIAEHYGARLHAPAAELANIAKHSPVQVPLDHRHRDDNGVEVIPTPGHSPGSTSYLVDGADGRYLFTGDTVFVDHAGRWSTFVIPGVGDAAAMAESLRLLATLQPDVVISSAFAGAAVSEIDDRGWAACIDEAMESVPA